MKTILYMAQSLNGYIAKQNGDTAWIGSSDKAVFKQKTLAARNVVMGRSTYEVMLSEGSFPLDGRLNVVMTREIKESDSDNVLFTNKTPGEVLDYMREQQFAEVMVIGGGKIAKSFLEQNLIQEIFVTIEPILLGKGVSFIEHGEFMEQGDLEVNLEFLDFMRISKNELQLHYKVVSEKILESDGGKENESVTESNL